MPGFTIGQVMGQGFPGSYSKNGANITKARPVNSTDANPIMFGDAVFMTTDSTVLGGGAYSSTQSVVAASGTPALANFVGVAVREVKTNETYNPSPAFGSYLQGQECDALEWGSCSVQVHVGTPTAGGNVFLRIALNGAIPAGVIGGFETAADGGNTIALTNCKWTDGLIDSNGVAEITILSRNLP